MAASAFQMEARQGAQDLVGFVTRRYREQDLFDDIDKARTRTR